MHEDNLTTREPPTDDQVGELLRLVGPREEVPALRQERVRAAVRDVWLEEVRGRSQRRIARWTTGALAMAAALVLALGLGMLDRPDRTIPVSDPTVPVATVETAPASGSWSVGQQIFQGQRLRTAAGERLALRLEGGVSLRIDAGTALRLDTATSIRLDEGAVYVDSGVSETEIRIQTPLGLARDVGTQFEVRVHGHSLRLRVREGTVILEGSGEPQTAVAGEELELTEQGVDRSDLQDRVWSWVLQTAPARNLHEVTLEDILDWTARETGWRIEGLDHPVVRATLGEHFDGDLEIAPDEVPSILPTFGLTGQLDGNGTLRIHP